MPQYSIYLSYLPQYFFQRTQPMCHVGYHSQIHAFLIDSQMQLAALCVIDCCEMTIEDQGLVHPKI